MNIKITKYVYFKTSAQEKDLLGFHGKGKGKVRPRRCHEIPRGE
jgi:hypothetical protein